MSIQASSRYKPEDRTVVNGGGHHLHCQQTDSCRKAIGNSTSDGANKYDYAKMDESDVVDDKLFQQVLFERRLMLGCIVLAIANIILFLVSVCSNYWIIVTIDGPVRQTDGTDIDIHTTLRIGIWMEYRVQRFNNGSETGSWIMHFPSPPPDVSRLANLNVPHYYRAQAVFSIIGLALMFIANVSAFYSLKNSRYMYKRLTAFVYAFAAMCVLVVIEVMIHHTDEWSLDKMSGKTMEAVNSHVKLQCSYGFSTVLAWIVFAAYCVAPPIFIYGSRKRKGDRAVTQELEVEDRPVELGR